MLTLIEPIKMIGVSDRPHLGCAMLIATCQGKGIKTTLIQGQTRYLKDMFVNDSEELWGLIHDLKDNDLKKLRIVEYKRFIQRKGIKQFQAEFKDLYHKVIIDKNPRNYFNAQVIEKFNNLFNTFVGIYFYYLRELNYGKLMIIDRYVSGIIKSNPRYIGFSLEGGFGPLSRAIRKRIKELTEIPIIVGGALTPFIDSKKLDKTFKEEYFDYLVIGAGDYALPSLIQALENKKEPKGIMNVFYKKNSKIEGNDLGVINDLDSLPYPDYSQFYLDLYLTPKRILPFQSARGCSWRKCTFCSHHSIDFGNYKIFSTQKVIETIQHLQNIYKCSHFFLNDEGLPPGRAKIISEYILNNKLNIYIDIHARLIDGYNNNLLRFMRKAGFTAINWGMESGCQRILDLMNKRTKVSNMSKILRQSSKNKIANFCSIIFGFPGETKKEAQQTVEFLKNHADYIEQINATYFHLDLYSPIGKNLEKWGIDIKEDGSFSTRNGMSREETSAFCSRFIEELEANSIKLTSNKLRYLLPGNNSRTLHFLASSSVFLSNAIIKRRKLNKVFPIILGEIKRKDSRATLYPINIKETVFINCRYPEKEKFLDCLEEKIFILSDGTLSIEDIILTIYNDFKREYSKEYIHKKCTGFFQNIFSKNWGLYFAKSWRSS